MKKTIFYSAIGGVLEFYDFIIFAIFANAITKSFFPANNYIAGLFLTFSIFAIGYLARPIGGIIFGHFGDKYGRKKTFTYSIILMAISTICIAFVPTYKQIGILAPIILTLLRLLQGISIGGEVPGAITFISETVPKIKTFACSVVFFGLVLGIILGQLMHIFLSNIFNSNELMLYGWRIAFLIGGIFGIWGFFLRKKLVETPLFTQMEKIKIKVPIIKVFKEHSLAIFYGWALMGLVSAGIMVLFLIMPAYSKLINLPKSDVSIINILILFVTMIFAVIFGYIGDKINKKILILIPITTGLIFSIFIFNSLISGYLSLTIYCIFTIFTLGISFGIIPSILAEIFPLQIRYSGIGITFNLSLATTGGLAPMIIFYLISKYNNLLIPAIYYIVVIIISLIGLIFYSKAKKYSI